MIIFRILQSLSSFLGGTIMSSITFKGTPAHTVGTLPDVGETAKEFNLTGQDLSEVTLATFGSKRKILNIFPSVDTGVCAASVRAFHKAASRRSRP